MLNTSNHRAEAPPTNATGEHQIAFASQLRLVVELSDSTFCRAVNNYLPGVEEEDIQVEQFVKARSASLDETLYPITNALRYCAPSAIREFIINFVKRLLHPVCSLLATIFTDTDTCKLWGHTFVSETPKLQLV